MRAPRFRKCRDDTVDSDRADDAARRALTWHMGKPSPMPASDVLFNHLQGACICHIYGIHSFRLFEPLSKFLASLGCLLIVRELHVAVFIVTLCFFRLFNSVLRRRLGVVLVFTAGYLIPRKDLLSVRLHELAVSHGAPWLILVE